MAITIDWLDAEQKTIIVTFDDWTLIDFYEMIDEESRMLAGVTHTVDIISDFTNAKTPPRDLINGMRYAEKKVQPNQGVIVYIKPGPFISILVKMAKQLRMRGADLVFIADTLDEAHAIIAAERENVV